MPGLVMIGPVVWAVGELYTHTHTRTLLLYIYRFEFEIELITK